MNASREPVNCDAHSTETINSFYAAHCKPIKACPRPSKAERGRDYVWKPKENVEPPSNGTSIHSIPIVLSLYAKW